VFLSRFVSKEHDWTWQHTTHWDFTHIRFYWEGKFYKI